MNKMAMFFFWLQAMLLSWASYSYCIGNSCWNILNNSEQPISINCIGYGNPQFFKIDNLQPGRRHSELYDRSWGDGLGYPEPNVWFACIVENAGRRATVNFSTLSWGDFVNIVVDNNEVLVRQDSTGRQQTTVGHFIDKIHRSYSA